MKSDKIFSAYNRKEGTTMMKFSWLKYFKGVIGMDDVNINVDKDTVVIVKDPDYYKKLFPLIDKYPKRTVANYIIWRLMKNRAYNLPKRFMDAITEYNKELYGISVNRARWRECSSYVKAKMGVAAGRLFIEKAFDEVAKKDVGIFTRTAALFFNFVYHKRFRTAESNVMVDMIINIQDAFKDLITDLDWMSETTKNVAKEKIAVWISLKIINIYYLNLLHFVDNKHYQIHSYA
ncbi:hypothetical protein KUTeg_002690 [Tegillarca granosa]|uniref:Peptidase M13 N-terminal domain-containing protein n=1 Tax=Tegillarca granosa TaxID=220873 RepID=A0ABQ9FZI6_TEGGR|nr:hypothetical protein KUTeg_002690 [Tegillarca granosa]